MITSMTGFGRSRRELDDFIVTVEIKTVNHRFSEYNIRMPHQLLNIEDKIKKKVAEYVVRGRVEMFITIQGTGQLKSKVTVDWNLIDEYYEALKEIQAKYKLEKGIALQDLLAREDFIMIDEQQVDNKALELLVLETTEAAATQLKQMRIIEGQALEQELAGFLVRLTAKMEHLRAYAPVVVELYTERLRKRMDDFLNGSIDEVRLVNEVAIFADKVDINEELTRLESHLKQFQKNLAACEPIGRKLDFLLQEMNREVNTIGSKANDSTITNEVVDMKSMLEKMKEQVQNIE